MTLNTITQQTQLNNKLREAMKKERQALLMRVDAIEEYLDMPRTSEVRQYAKEKGFYDKYRVVKADLI